MKKYRTRFPPDELDLKICKLDCKTSKEDTDSCKKQCDIDLPIDKFQKSDPCEGIKPPLDKNDADKFNENGGVLIRRKCKIKRIVPIFRVSDVVITRTGYNANNLKTHTIIKVILPTEQLQPIRYNIQSDADKSIIKNIDENDLILNDDAIKEPQIGDKVSYNEGEYVIGYIKTRQVLLSLPQTHMGVSAGQTKPTKSFKTEIEGYKLIDSNNSVTNLVKKKDFKIKIDTFDKYEVEFDDKETQILYGNDIRLVSDDNTVKFSRNKFKKDDDVYIYQYGSIEKIILEEQDLTVQLIENGSEIDIDMHEAIPYFKVGDQVNYASGKIEKYNIIKVTTDYVIISKVSNQEIYTNSPSENEEDLKIIKINKMSSFTNNSYSIGYFNEQDTLEIPNLKKSKSLGNSFKDGYKAFRDFFAPLVHFVKQEGMEFGREVIDDIAQASDMKEEDKCSNSIKQYVGLLDMDLPLKYILKQKLPNKVKNLFFKKLTVAQKRKLYKKFENEYKKESLTDDKARTLKPFSKKFWYLYTKYKTKNTNNNEATLKDMNKAHNELIKLKKCGCLEKNAPINKCTYLNKTLNYFQQIKKNSSTSQVGGNKVYSKIMKKNKPSTENSPDNESTNSTEDPLIKLSTPNENDKNESTFKKKFIDEFSKRLDETRGKLYDERIMLMKGVAQNDDKYTNNVFHNIKIFLIKLSNYFQTIDLRLEIFFRLRWGQVITIILLYIGFNSYSKNKNLTSLVIFLILTNLFYEMYTGTSNTIFKFLLFSLLTIMLLLIVRGMFHIFGKNSECSGIKIEDNIELTTFQNDIYLVSILGVLLFLISIRGLCNFVPWLNFDWTLYKIGLLIYLIQLNVTYHGEELTSPLGNVAETFFILCSFNAIYQYNYFPDTAGDDFKLKNLSKFGDVLKSEYYLDKLNNLNS
jgi:hypothetical protein